MLNLADPETALEWWRLPADGIGLARMEFVISEHLGVHPMALAHPDSIAQTRDLDRPAERDDVAFVGRLGRVDIRQAPARVLPEPIRQFFGQFGGRGNDTPAGIRQLDDSSVRQEPGQLRDEPAIATPQQPLDFPLRSSGETHAGFLDCLRPSRRAPWPGDESDRTRVRSCLILAPPCASPSIHR